MDYRETGEFEVIRKAIPAILICVGLTGLGLGLVFGAVQLMKLREPYVELSPDRPAISAPPSDPKREDCLRFAVATMVSAETTFHTYQRLVKRIGRDVGLEESFVLRPSYADVRGELEKGEVDVAFVCTGTYVYSLPKGRVKLLVQPEFKEGLQYRSVFLVPADSPIRNLEDLAGKVMAFTDRESNTGCLVPSAMLVGRGASLKTYFKKVVFTGSHDRSIRAVALKTVDVAAVDSLVWKSNLREDPSLADRVKVMWRSEPFGPPPIVVPRGLRGDLESSLRRAFLALDKDEEGRKILEGIGIKRFVPAREQDYESVIKLYRKLSAQGGIPWR